MEIHAVRLVDLLAAHRELVLDQFDRQILGAETRDGERDAQAVLADLLDIVRRVAFGALGQPVERALELVEAQQQRRVEYRYATHKPSSAERVARNPIWAFLGMNLGCPGRRSRPSGGPDGLSRTPKRAFSGHRHGV